MLLSEDLQGRGLLRQLSSAGLAELLDRSRLTVYAGFDPTADSLHLGNLLGLVTLRRLQIAGHRPILVAGGGTGMIGDPSGRSTERQLLGDETLGRNTAAIKGQMARIFDFAGENAAILVDNRSWLEELDLISFLRDIGKHFTLSEMLAKESVRSRLGDTGISYTEFSYMVLQAYDFLQLFDRYGCTLQIGGSDQWGNITAGIDLIRRARGAEAFALTVPLITRADGTKFGKSTGNALWLDPEKTRPYQLYQFLVRSDDTKVIEYLKLLTLVDLAEIGEIAARFERTPGEREPHYRLAREVVAMVHGEEEARAAETASRALFAGSIEAEPAEVVAVALREAPRVRLPRGDLAAGAEPALILVAGGVVRSKSEARRLIEQGGVYLNGARLEAGRNLFPGDLNERGFMVLRRGKKDYVVVEA